jgi:hypothetical protein
MNQTSAYHVKEILYLFKGIRRFGGRGTIRSRQRIAWLLRALQWQKYKKRRDLAQELPLANGILIPEDTGYAELSAFEPGYVRGVVESANAHWASFDLACALKERGSRPFVAQGLGGRLERNDPILKLALHPSVVAAVSRYIGMVPVIENITIWYSPNDRALENSSQYYHLDGQDVRTVQLFVLLDRVADENGPLLLVRADESEALAERVQYRKTPSTKRLEDAVVEAAASEVMRFTGNAGDVLIADTDRCFHLGSREGKAPRRVLVIQYYSPFAFVLPHRWDRALPLVHLAARPEFNSTERLVLGAR